jgi:hypothetical protein
MSHSRRSLSYAIFTLGICAMVGVACGSKSQMRDGGQKPATGGAPGSGGTSASGGMLGAGGTWADGSTALSCADDGGLGLPPAARRCGQDADCTIAIAARCCGPDLALGLAKSESSTYAGCLAPPPGGCQGLGCAKYLGYLTDTGRATPVVGASENPIDFVSVHCLSQLCTADVVERDAGADAPTADAPRADAPIADVPIADAPATDGAPDAAAEKCGDAAACGPRQACFLIGGGPVPLCESPIDAGTCREDLVLVASCSVGGGPTYWQPGCTPPPPSPKCTQLPDGCGDPCACLCPNTIAGACHPMFGYIACSMP